jgi:anthranilate phosphoribosyltransferase
MSALDLLSSEEAGPEARAAFLMGLRVRGETADEIEGAARLLRERMIGVDAPEMAVDIVGTGGDGHGTYNISTCAALVAAGAGLTVAKHGNRSVSSKSGASDVLSALGVKIDCPLEVVARAIKEVGVGFLWAPMHHPMMKTWAPVRGELGIRSLFNLLGPLANPARVRRQVVGVYSDRWVEPVAEALSNLGCAHGWVVHGSDGMDELTTTGPTMVAEVAGGGVSVFRIQPEDVGLKRASLDDLKGGDAVENAEALRSVLEGAEGAYRDIVVLNAGAALVVGDMAANLEQGVAGAQAAIDDGRAKAKLDDLVAITNG